MSFSLDWRRDGTDWPLREHSRFIEAGGIRWHVQALGDGPVMLLLHGSGAATHSWRDVAPRLAERYRVIAPDLPGHGFTGPPPGYRMRLPEMAGYVGALLDALGEGAPSVAVGHSAGAAIMLRMALDSRLAAARALIAINGALKPFPGAAGTLFPALAKALFVNPLMPSLVSWRASWGGGAAVARIIAGTGSRLDARGLALYARLIQSPAHVEGTLGMMANWNLAPLVADLPRLATPLTLIVGEKDMAVPPSVADDAAARAPGARVVRLAGLGHLAHEEAPQAVVDLIAAAAADAQP